MKRFLALVVLVGCAEKKQPPPPREESKPDPPRFQHQTGLVFDVPGAWKKETPASNMRKAQYAVPDKEKRAKDAEFVLFYFGAGGGGGVDANIDRWVGQFAGAKRETAKIEKLKGVYDVTLVDLTGTYVAEMSPGSEERRNDPDTRMLAAILDTPKGLHFFKFVGPAATVGGWVDDFRKLVTTAKLP